MRALPPPRHVKAEGVELKEISAQVQMSRGTLPSLLGEKLQKQEGQPAVPSTPEKETLTKNETWLESFHLL